MGGNVLSVLPQDLPSKTILPSFKKKSYRFYSPHLLMKHRFAMQNRVKEAHVVACHCPGGPNARRGKCVANSTFIASIL